MNCGQATHVTIPLALARATIRGVVRDQDISLHPILGALVALKTGERTYSHTDGSFEFTNVVCHPNEVTVSKFGYPTYKNAVAPACGSTTNLDIRLGHVLVFVSGTVTDAVTGDPINGATVDFGGRQTLTNVDGAYHFGDSATCDDAPLRVERPNYAPHSQMVSPACAGNTTANVALEPTGANPRERVIFVHGICGDGSMWDGMAAYFAQNGFDVRKMSYKPNNARPIEGGEPVAQLREIVGRSPRPIHFVAHSMGGLVVREYLKEEEQHHTLPNVKTVVTLGTPHHGADVVLAAYAAGLKFAPIAALIEAGTLLADLPGHRLATDAVKDMLPGSAFLNRLNYGRENVDLGLSFSWDNNPPPEESGQDCSPCLDCGDRWAAPIAQGFIALFPARGFPRRRHNLHRWGEAGGRRKRSRQ